MGSFPKIRTSLGDYVDSLVGWIDRTFESFFDFIFTISSSMINGLDDFLVWLPWWLFILIIVLITWYCKSFFSDGLYGSFVFLIGTLGLWQDTSPTSAIINVAVNVCVIIGIPAGVWMSFSKRFSSVMRPLLDAMQTMPSFVYLIPAIFFFGLGNVSAIFATLIYALPPVIRLTELAIRGVDDEVIESAISFGSSRWQMLRKVQLPQALPTIMAGVNQTTMMALSMVVVASMVGAKGLGEQVLVSINQID